MAGAGNRVSIASVTTRSIFSLCDSIVSRLQYIALSAAALELYSDTNSWFSCNCSSVLARLVFINNSSAFIFRLLVKFDQCLCQYQSKMKSIQVFAISRVSDHVLLVRIITSSQQQKPPSSYRKMFLFNCGILLEGLLLTAAEGAVLKVSCSLLNSYCFCLLQATKEG